MIYSIENEFLEVQISSVGAELMSIKSKADGTEYLWQGNTEFWGGRAYNLFPIVGRLTEGKYTFNGKTYEMNLHGFVRKSELDATKLENNKIDFGIKATDKTRAMYPFEFEYHILYTLVGDTVKMDISVTNHDEKVMSFALGGHPGFNVPLSDDKFEDYYLEFALAAQPKAIYMSDTCFVTNTVTNFPLEDDKILHLSHSLFDRDAIVLQDICHTVTLKSSVSKRAVTLKFPEAMKYLGIWHAPKKEAPYVALEPWTSLPA
ncbi:MAG: aldose 1-epimerase family protein, partial [Clostridia bacterium]